MTAIMKYLALALALLLAVGSHATPAPDNLSNLYSEFKAGMTQTIGSLKHNFAEALNRVQDGPEKDQLKQWFDGIIEKVDNAVLLTDGAASTAIEATAEIRGTIKADIAEIKTETANDVARLKEILEKHAKDYVTFIENLRANPHLVDFGEKLKLTLVSLKSTFDDNVQETQTALTPIIEEIKTASDKWAERIKSHVSS